MPPVLFSENQARSTLSMFGAGCMPKLTVVPIPPTAWVAMSWLSFSAVPYWDAVRAALESYTTCDGLSTTGEAVCFVSKSCIYCQPEGLYTQPECILTLAPESAPSWQACGSARGEPGERPAGDDRPIVTLTYQDGYTDADGDAARIQTKEAWRYYVRSPAMYVAPCADLNNYCTPYPYYAKWLCRWYTYNEAHMSWKMYCNGPLNTGYQTPASQNVPREFEVGLALTTFTRAPILVRFGYGSTDCWSDLDDVYCFSDGCYDHETGKVSDVWNCVGAEYQGESHAGQRRVDGISDGMLIVPDLSLNTSEIASGGLYPQHREWNIGLKNLCWAEVTEYLVEKLGAAGVRGDYPGAAVQLQHGAGGDFQAIGKSKWSAVINFGAEEREVGNALIQLYEPRLGWILPARMFLDSLTISMTLNVEPRWDPDNDVWTRRVFCAIHFALNVKVRRYSETETGLAAHDGHLFRWSIEEDASSFDVLDPVNGGVHPNIHLIPRAIDPDGGRAAMAPLTMHWHGLKAESPYSRGSDAYLPPPCDLLILIGTEHPSCCYSYQTIHRGVDGGGTIIHAEVNNHANPSGVQRYEGSVSLRVKNIDSLSSGWGCQCVV